jgi:hypothetical protein
MVVVIGSAFQIHTIQQEQTTSKFCTGTTPSPHLQIIKFHIEIWSDYVKLANQ